MEYDITHAIRELKPGAEWSLVNEDYARLTWLDGSQTKPTEAEINDKITALNAAESMRLLRIERNVRLSNCDWKILPDTTLSDSKVVEWKTYRQALRDLPASATPKLNDRSRLDLTSVTWPTEPS